MNVVIAGGGTGGHLYPGIAIAEEFRTRSGGSTIAFIGTRRGLEARVVPEEGFHLLTIPARGFMGKGLRGKIASLCALPGATLRAGACLRRCRADIVLGLGGYIALPSVIAGKTMHIPAVIHEQNICPGLSNRLLGQIADTVCLTFAESAAGFPRATTTVCTGLPVRRRFFSSGSAARQDRRFCVFICGGSLGARQINAAIMEALPLLTPHAADLRFIHQTGEHDFREVAEGYDRHGLQAHVAPFFTDMHLQYRQADLVICRSGAGTLAELAICAKAALLIPYPHAAGNHQEKNARVFADRGAAMILHSDDVNGQNLVQLLLTLREKPDCVQSMEAQSARLARPDAAACVVDVCTDLVRKKHSGGPH